MKVHCDVCEAAEASVVCCADEAALCKSCDIQIHDANKLSSKHQRVPLVMPQKPTRCDICQEKNAYFFCLEDRALLCHSCDMSIHLSNASTSGHRRFLVTGVTASLHTISASGLEKNSISPETHKLKTSKRKSPLVKPPVTTTTTTTSTTTTPSASSSLSTCGNSGSNKTSILEFLTEDVPGWKCDELLNDIVNPCNKQGAANKGQAQFHMDGSFNWLGYSNTNREEFYSRSVPQMTRPAAINVKCNKSNMDMADTVSTKLTTRNDTTTPYMTEADDSSLVPDLGLRSPPEIIPPIKRRRMVTNYSSELDSILLHHQQQLQQHGSKASI